MNAPQSSELGQHVLIIHEVEDYDQWKAIFNEAAGIRRDAGEIAYQLLA